MAELVTLSASKLKTWNTCHKMYYFSYVERRRGPKSPAAITGSSVHKAVELTFADIIAGKDPNDPIETYNKAYQQELQENPESPINRRSFDDGMKMVDQYDFYKRIPIEIERKFTLPFPNAENPICYITGFIDQMYPWGLVDMKTSREKPLLGTLGFDAQFILYDWAFEQLNGEKAQAIVWQHLRTGEDIIAPVQEPGKLDYVVAGIEDIVAREEARQAFQDPSMLYERNIGTQCRWCDHRLVCLGRDN